MTLTHLDLINADGITHNSSLKANIVWNSGWLIIHTLFIFCRTYFFFKCQACCIFTLYKKMRKKLNGQLVSANNVGLYNLFFFSVRGLHYCSQSINSCKLISTSLKIESKSRQKTWLQNSNKSQQIQTDYRVHVAPYINTEIIQLK